MRWASVVSALPGDRLASSAIRCSFVETLGGLCVPCIFPSNGSVDRLSLPSAGFLGWVPPLPRYYGELRRPLIPPASLRRLRLAVPDALACSLRRTGSATTPPAWTHSRGARSAR